MTNYEKIKSMSIYELAELLFLAPCKTCQYNGNCPDELEVNCFYEIKQWLESEAEPNFCTDKQNKLVHCENCHEECKFDKFE